MSRASTRWFAAAAVALACLVVAADAGAAATGLRVAIYAGTGADATTTLALFRAVAAVGHQPMAVTTADLERGQLESAAIDVLVIPPGEAGRACCFGYYGDGAALGGPVAQAAIRAFVSSGGGVVAEDAGALFASANGGTLDLYTGAYIAQSGPIGPSAVTITDPIFGSGTLQAWRGTGTGYFATPPLGATTVAVDAQGRPAIVRQSLGAGRVILTAFTLELRGDSTIDWTIWDDWTTGGVHPGSAQAWATLGRLIGWASPAHDAGAPIVAPAPLPPGVPVAVLAEHTLDGGAWPGLLPAVGRSIEAAGHVPLAIRFQDIHDGRLTIDAFKVLTVPGGYAYGYKTGLAGAEARIRRFVRSGGGYYGICAGSFYASPSVVWQQVAYPYPLALYPAETVGPIDDIAPWPNYALASVDLADPLLGLGGRVQALYYGGGYHRLPPSDPRLRSTVWGAPAAVATFTTSSAAGQAGIVRYGYGLGHVALSTMHLEARAGSAIDDWLLWDDTDALTGAPVVNPDNPWTVVSALFNSWLTR